MPIFTLYQFGAAVLELQFRLGGRNDSSQGVAFANRCSQWLNSAQLLMARSLISIPDLDTARATLQLLPNINEYNRNTTLPPMTDFIGIQVVQIVDTTVTPQTRFRMRRMPYSEYQALSQLPTGQPRRWTRRGNRIAFDFFPDKAGYNVNFDYRARPVLNQVSIDAEYQEQWIQLAKYMAWSALDQETKAQQALSELPSEIQAMIQSPLDEEQWESFFDPDQIIAPMGFERGWAYVS
jgi:hypothetical protein